MGNGGILVDSCAQHAYAHLALEFRDEAVDTFDDKGLGRAGH